MKRACFKVSVCHFEWQTFESPESAAAALGEYLDAGRPTLLLTDIFYLPYFNSSTHFSGHAIAAWSRNPETGDVLVTDTERPSALSVTQEALTSARFSKQPPFIHYGNMFTPTAFQGEITPEIITSVIHDNAKSLAVRGISALKTWLAELSRWGTTGDWHWTTRFAYQVIEKRGTGGGGFRKMYAGFLDEAVHYDANVQKYRLPLLMRACEKTWTALAMCFKSASESTHFPHAAIEEAIFAVMQAERNYANAAIAL
ncbi:MAG: BtrH N-terminal domain-containing protein [Agitococcus sp.]|nr:BtrH N-terminal domain-containing protein [Agitococcus sp.]